MRDRQYFTVGRFLVVGQILPQVTRVRAALGRRHREGHYLPCSDRTVTHDDDTVHVGTLDQRGPFDADQVCKTPRIVERLGIGDDLFPEVLVEFGAR